MSNVDWDSKTVIGQKGKAPKVTRNTSDLNGTPRHVYMFGLSSVADKSSSRSCMSLISDVHRAFD